MPSYQPVIKNGGAIFYLSLLDTAATGSFKVNPTIAAGDFKVSIDGAAFANMTTLPTVTPAGGSQVKFTLSAAETNGDNVSVQCVDQTAPKEWVDAFVRIQTAAGSFDTLQTDTNDIQARLPAALVAGRMDSSVGAVAASAITAAAIATDAIGSAQLATTAVTEIQTGLATSAAQTTIQADLDNIQTRLPAALVGGRMDSSMGNATTGSITAPAFAAGAINAAAIAADAIGSSQLAATATAEIADAIWDEILSGHVVAGSAGAALTAAGSSGDPWVTALPGAYGAGTAGNILGSRLDAAVSSRLAPTVAARTLDVSATGEAGLDWANIGSPATAVSLTSTVISVNQQVASVSGAVGSVTGGVGGNVGGSVGSIGVNGISLSSFQTNSITAAALATDAVTEIQTGLATSASIAAVQADTDNIQTRLPAALVGGRMDSYVGQTAANVINSSSIAAAAITSEKFDIGAIDASALATDAVAEIQAGLATSASIAAVQSDTDNIQTRLPAALVGGRIDASVGVMQNGVIGSATFTAGAISSSTLQTNAINANALAADAVVEIVNGVWDADATGHQIQGTFGQAIGDPVLDTRTIYSMSGQIKADTAALVVTVETNLDAKVSSRLAPTTAGRTLDVSVGGEAGIDWANIGSPMTAVGLFNTQIQTVTQVLSCSYVAEVQQVDSLIPGAIDDNVFTAAAVTQLASGFWEEDPAAHPNFNTFGLLMNNLEERRVLTTNLAYTVPAIGRGTVWTDSTIAVITTGVFDPNTGAADQFVGRVVLFDADTTTVALRGCARAIIASTNGGATPIFTVEALTAAPVMGDKFSVI